MGKVNWGRVILGGLLAGVVINIIYWVGTAIFSERYQAAMQDLGKSMEGSAGAMVMYLILGFLVGIFAVWLYAAIRPRYGAGPKTALCAGLATWFVFSVLTTLDLAAAGLFPGSLLAIGVVIGLVALVLGTELGAWLYKEA